MEKKISKATMSRFPVYLKALRKMQHEGKETSKTTQKKQKTTKQQRKDYFLPT